MNLEDSEIFWCKCGRLYLWIILHTYHTSPFLLWILSAFGHGDIRRKVNKRQTTNVKTMRILGLVVLPGNQAAFKKEASRWHWVTFSNQSLKQIIPVSQYYMLYQFSGRSPNISSSPHFPPQTLGPSCRTEIFTWPGARFQCESEMPFQPGTPWGFGHVELETHCSCSTQWFFVPILRWIETFVESTKITNNQPLFHQAGTTDLNHFNQHPVSIFTKLIKTNLFVWWGEPIGSKLQPLISVCIVQLTTLSLYINSWGEFSESWPLGKFLHDQSS